MLSMASSKEQLDLVHAWYFKTTVAPVTITTVQMHLMVKMIFRSTQFDQATKDKALVALKAVDSSDKFGLTEKYCQAAIPTIENKRAVWKTLFGAESDKLGLYDISNLCMGFRPISQRALVAEFAD